MKITETIERECCHPSRDLKYYKGINKWPRIKFSFCVHCGQVWQHSSEMGPAGSSDPCLVKVHPGD